MGVLAWSSLGLVWASLVLLWICLGLVWICLYSKRQKSKKQLSLTLHLSDFVGVQFSQTPGFRNFEHLIFEALCGMLCRFGPVWFWFGLVWSWLGPVGVLLGSAWFCFGPVWFCFGSVWVWFGPPWFCFGFVWVWFGFAFTAKDKNQKNNFP